MNISLSTVRRASPPAAAADRGKRELLLGGPVTQGGSRPWATSPCPTGGRQSLLRVGYDDSTGASGGRTFEQEATERRHTRPSVLFVISCWIYRPGGNASGRRDSGRPATAVGIGRESSWCCSFSASLCVLGASAFGFSTQRPRSSAESSSVAVAFIRRVLTSIKRS